MTLAGLEQQKNERPGSATTCQCRPPWNRDAVAGFAASDFGGQFDQNCRWLHGHDNVPKDIKRVVRVRLVAAMQSSKDDNLCRNRGWRRGIGLRPASETADRENGRCGAR